MLIPTNLNSLGMALIGAFFFAFCGFGHAGDARTSDSPAEPWVAPVNDDAVTAPPAPKASAVLATESTPAPDEYSLGKLLDIALANSPTTRQSWESARQAAARLGQANSSYFPKLTTGVTVGGSSLYGVYSYQTEDLNSPPGAAAVPSRSRSGPSAPSITPQVTLSYLLLDFGARDAAADSARQSMIASNFTFNQSLLNLILQVQTDYYNLDNARSQLKVAESAVDLSKASMEAAEIKERSGLASKTDFLSARQSYASDVFDAEQARAQVASSQATLLKDVGLPANAPVKVAAPEEALLLPEMANTVDQLIDAAMQQRPDLAAKYATLKSQQAALRKAELSYFPTASLSATGQREFYQTETATFSTTGANQDHRGYTDTVTAGVAFSVDLFDGLNKVNQVRAARGAVESARADLLSSQLQATGDVWTNFFNYNSNRKQLDYARDWVKSAEESHAATLVGYKSGLNSSLDLLTAQNNLAKGRSALVKARTGLIVSSIQLTVSTGRGNVPPFVTRGDPVPPPSDKSPEHPAEPDPTPAADEK